MAFMTNCTTKGCRKHMEPYLNPATNDVHCSECDEPIANIPVFTKNLMKTLNQVKKSAKVAFAIKCVKCKTDALPKLDANNKLVCVSCGNALNISKIYENQIREIIKNGGHKDL